MKSENFRPNRIGDYFRAEWKALGIVTVSGLVYNLGLTLGPWFEGKMAGKLAEIIAGTGTFRQMLALAIGYLLAVALVQGMRYVKRFYVRRFANNVSRRMKRVLYANLIRKSRTELASEGAGSLLTKAIQDADDCAEGMRKFTTEVFDTGIALAAYAVMLLNYDVRLALICMCFPPISYFLAEKMKRQVQKTGAASKKQAGRLNEATLDRAENAITYRVYGCDDERRQDYERELDAYEQAAVQANLLTNVLSPLYRAISLIGVLPILWFGAKNVTGRGWTAWDIAAFTTFLSCFAKLAKKSSGAAKLFNAVHRAKVSWNRICPLLNAVEPLEDEIQTEPQTLHAENVSFAYPNGAQILNNVNFTLQPGQILGVAGPVACGKSTLGKLFLCENPYAGSIRFGEKEISQMSRAERIGAFAYLGHDPELFSGSIEENICLGRNMDVAEALRAVCMDRETAEMEDGIQTKVGSGGVRLSGGQAQRLALARTILQMKPVVILDDPFSALDRQTEREIFAHLRARAKNSAVILISHRLYLFDQTDQVIWLENGCAHCGTHGELMRSCPEYAKSFLEQGGEQ